MLLLVLVVACVGGVRGGDVVDEMGRLGASTALQYAQQVGLVQEMRQGYLTLFVPTNQAFASLPQAYRDIYEKNPDYLKTLLRYHAVSGIFRSVDAFNDLKLTSTMGQDIRVNVYQPSSVGAPVVTLDGARVLKADVQATNGYVHLIDRLIWLQGSDAVNYTASNKQLSIFLKALQASGIMDELKADGLTLFAPSDEAFRSVIAKVGQNQFDLLLQNKPMLQDLIRYHVMPHVIYSAGAVPGTYQALDFKPFNISVSADQLYYINDAQVVMGDIPVGNGVVHIINKVLIPPRYPQLGRPVVG